jgi:hypothetical protein
MCIDDGRVVSNFVAQVTTTSYSALFLVHLSMFFIASITFAITRFCFEISTWRIFNGNFGVDHVYLFAMVRRPVEKRTCLVNSCINFEIFLKNEVVLNFY